MQRTASTKFLSLAIPTLAAILGIATQRPAAAVLVGSPWPQFGINAAGTRHSSYAGPTVQPKLKWFFPTSNLVYASPIFGQDLTVYTSSYNGTIYAIEPDGDQKWARFVGGNLRGAATVAADGSIYQLSNSGLLHVDSNGQVLTNNPSLGNNDPSVTIADDGRLYVASGSELHYTEPNGANIWSINVGGLIGSTPVIGNGNVYFGSSTNSGVLNAVNSQGQLLWTFPISGQIVKSAAVGSDGTIYAGGQSSDFFAINPNGTEKWRFTASDEIFTAPAIGSDGSVIFASTNAIFALDSSGKEKWRYSSLSFGHGSVVIDANGNVFATRNDHVIALSSTGSLMWDYALGSSNYIHSSVTLDSTGTLYFGAANGLYAIAAPVPEPGSAVLLASMLTLGIGLRRRS